MKPSRLQYFFAEYPPHQIYLMLGALAGAVFFGSLCSPTFELLTHGDYLMCIVPAAVLGAGVGFFFAPLACLPFLPVIWWREKQNGAPFCEGDMVTILSKSHRGRTARVYAVWGERHQVRVEMGEKEKDAVEDVFSFTQVWKVPDAALNRKQQKQNS